MDDLDGMVEDGWTQADGLAAETNILMRQSSGLGVDLVGSVSDKEA